MLPTKTVQKETVVKNALKIVAILNKHLSEENCEHTVKEIAVEALRE